MAARFSREQLAAIRIAGANVLVSAAAGAGKTSVLVERVARLALLGADPAAPRPVPLRSLLVVTFTRAAAREMRERIARSLQARLEHEPENVFLREQLAQLERAPIGTISSFCGDVVRENFHILGINPGVDVLDEAEAELLWAEQVEKVFARRYADESHTGESFRRLVEVFGGRESDRELALQVRRLADFFRTSLEPDGWRVRALGQYREVAALAESGIVMPEGFRATRMGAAWTAALVERIELEAEGLRRYLAELTRAADTPDLPRLEWTRERLGVCANLAEGLRSGTVRELAAESMDWLQLAQLPRGKAPAGTAEARELLTPLFVRPFQEFLKGTLQLWARFTSADWAGGVRRAEGVVAALFELVDAVLLEYAAAKSAQNAFDFSDMERKAFEVLCDPGSTVGTPRPSAVARRYRDRFEEVLVDEFQDVNELQGGIIRLLSRQDDERGRAPNLFAVGDIKQSIYAWRLAEPDLFLRAYREATAIEEDFFLQCESGDGAGRAPLRPASGAASYRIDLPRNYRSRAGVVDATNLVFRKLMDTTLGGLDYDAASELVCGRRDEGGPVFVEPGAPDCPVLHLVSEAAAPADDGDSAGDADGGGAADAQAAQGDSEDASSVERQADAAALLIARALGRDATAPQSRVYVLAPPVADPAAPARLRPAEPGDIVILARGLQSKAPPLVQALRRMGIPVAAPPDSSWLDSPEIREILSLLSLVDNSAQDIPLAAYLRSPVVGCTDTELLELRRRWPDAPFCDAVRRDAHRGPAGPLRDRLARALTQLTAWQHTARTVPLPEFLEVVLRDTAIRDRALAQHDAANRAAIIDVLRERAIQFDSFRQRGLHRFLRFLATLAETGARADAAPADGDGSNAVRIMTVHKSKGLEFPIVVLPFLDSRFQSTRDLGQPVLSDRLQGVGCVAPGATHTVNYPTPAHLALQAVRRRSLLAEELRLLYVAMTRARDHLILCGRVPQTSPVEGWRVLGDSPGVLPLRHRLFASSFLQWIGPAWVSDAAREAVRTELLPDSARARGAEVPAGDPTAPGAAAPGEAPDAPEAASRHTEDSVAALGVFHVPRRVAEALALPKGDGAPPADASAGVAGGGSAGSQSARAALERIRNVRPAPPAAAIKAKLSVTELKRLWESQREPLDGLADSGGDVSAPALRRRGAPPRIASPARAGAPSAAAAPAEAVSPDASALDPRLRGTLTHLVLQRLDLSRPVTLESIAEQVARLETAGAMPAGAAAELPLDAIAWFFTTDPGRRMLANPHRVFREIPFTGSISAEEVWNHVDDPAVRATFEGERVTLQGTIDCVIDDADGELVLVDYKTDVIRRADVPLRGDSYATQLRLYGAALADIFGRAPTRSVLAFLAPRVLYEPNRGAASGAG